MRSGTLVAHVVVPEHEVGQHPSPLPLSASAIAAAPSSWMSIGMSFAAEIEGFQNLADATLTKVN